MAKMRVLITVKTYPTLSGKYDELVCTAGVTEEGDWVRIYPIQFRKLAYVNQYKKYDWIEIDLVKNTSDFRRESYRPATLETEPLRIGEASKDNDWEERKMTVLKNVFTDLDELIADAKSKDRRTSLATFKPTKILDFTWEAVDREWDKDKIAVMNQLSIFEQRGSDFKIVRKLPYKFSYLFEDINGRKSKMMIEDWEVGALFWRYNNEKEACEKVRQKYFDDFAKTKDLYFFLGTTQAFHLQAKNPFMIIGTFHPTFPKPPKIDPQLSLF
ncbi:hypothetical protein [Runella sp.]|uniref:hypothetical protein n=1 Tax=Runella sp. TaxID=1960881 RepID=UPI003D0C9BC1